MTCPEMTMFRSVRRTIDQWRLVMGSNEREVGFHFKVSNVNKVANFTESYYFHVHVVACDVHFRYSDDAFMWTA